jgi:hypothetical protein
MLFSVDDWTSEDKNRRRGWRERGASAWRPGGVSGATRGMQLDVYTPLRTARLRIIMAAAGGWDGVMAVNFSDMLGPGG